MARHIINIAISSFFLTVFYLSISLTAVAEEFEFKSIPDNITPCVGDCQKEIYPYAVLSKDAYEDTHNDSDLPDNWSYVFTDNFGSYSGSVYLNSTEKKIVYAFRGTDGLVDLFEDLVQAIGVLPLSYAYAVATLYNHIAILKQETDTFKDWDLILTGHSLGGGLAQFVSKCYGLKAYTFNTAPISSKVGDMSTVVSYLTPFFIYYQGLVGIGTTDILNIVSNNTSGSYFDVVSWSPGDLSGTTKSLEIDDANGLISTHSINTIVSQLEQNFIWYYDSDNDGYGDSNNSSTAFSKPIGFVLDNTDCDDTDASIHPGAIEIAGDGIDQDCDGSDLPASSGDTTNTLGMTFVQIQPGTFMMGSPGDELGRYNNETQHQVTLTQGYYMQSTEVTQGQWEAVMGSNPSYFSNCGGDCPVEQVSWDDIQEFITEMNQRGEGTYALPTEAQWEYAARAGSTTAFANGDITEEYCDLDPNLDAMGWYCYNSDSKTHPAAQKQANAWGLYDMHGNVWEWCQDWYGSNYSSDAVTDPEGPSSGSGRVARGGSWSHIARYCRSALRYLYWPDYRNYLIGFRLVLSPGQ